MPTKIGHFEILSELAKSPTSTVYKAHDPESGQTIALKAIQLSAFGEHASALEQALLAEAENTKVLSSPNITNIFGAGQIDGQFCAGMDYVQGNSICHHAGSQRGIFHLGSSRYRTAVVQRLRAREVAQHCSLQSGTGQNHVRLGRYGQDSGLRRLQRRQLRAVRSSGSSFDPVLHVARTASGPGHRRPLESVQPGRDILRDGDRAKGI